MKNNLLLNIKNIMVYFICFSFIGWIYEFLLFIIEDHIVVNRGFLYGPWLPVYGFGGVIIYFLFAKLKDKPIRIKKINIRPLLLIIYISLIAVFVELMTTYICDILKINWQELWTYKDNFMNFQGRIALIPGLKFGIIGVIVIYFILPIIDRIKNTNNKFVKALIYIIIIIFFIDVFIHIFTGSTYVGPA